MNVRDMIPPAVHEAEFDLYRLTRIADCAGCYCLTNAGGDILYVGQAISVRQRLVQHFGSEKRTAMTALGLVSRAWWRSESQHKLCALERGWLEAIRLRDGQFPSLNRVSAPT